MENLGTEGTLSPKEQEDVKKQEGQQLAEAQLLATPEAQEQLTGSEASPTNPFTGQEVDAESSVSATKDVENYNLSSPSGSKVSKGGTF